MKLIVGLGNPGNKYQNTRHNLGQKIILEYLKKEYRTSLMLKKALAAKIFEVGQGSQKIIFAISTDYMNNSGISVKKLSQFYKISPNSLYLIHDDLDLKIGEYKTQFDRGAAGHNGVSSVVENIKTQAFHRIRIGIGKPTDPNLSQDYVLKPFSQPELDIINSITPKIFKIISDTIIDN